MKDIVIHATTTYDEQVCNSLVYLMLYKLRKWPRYAIISLGLVTAVAAAMIMLTEGNVSALPFLVMVLGSMLCMVGIYLKPIASKMLLASYGKKRPRFCYEFCTDEIHINYADNTRTYSYGFVLRLLEMSGMLFMFMKDGQVFILKHTDVKEGYQKLKTLLENQIRKS